MRLTKPSIISSVPVSVEKQDVISDTLGQCNRDIPELGAGNKLYIYLFCYFLIYILVAEIIEVANII